VLVYTDEHQVLLLERRNPEGFWQSVTGGLEEGESSQQAASRELFEETGIRAQPHNHAKSALFEISGPWRDRYHKDDTHNREHWFSLNIHNPVTIQLSDDEHSQYVWLPAKLAAERVSSHTNRAAIEEILMRPSES